MASKVLMGDMPELMENILNNLNGEIESLYSCTLVNRHWCKISIPILWQDPFSFDQDPLFISIYFSSLDEEDEQFILKEYGVNTKIPNTLFNYARFLKVLSLSNLESKVKKWIDVQLVGSNQYYKLKYHMINLLFKLIIESGATLHKLDFYFIEIKPEIFYSLGRNELFFSRLQDLSLSGISDFGTENANALLKILAKNTRKINSLVFDEFDSDYDPQACHSLVCIIKSQEKLKRFSIIGADDFPEEFNGVISALESQKQSLREVIIECCACNAEFKVLMSCENLEILRIRYCGHYGCTDLLKIIDYKVSTLEIVDCMIDATNMVLILEKSATLLQRLKLEPIDQDIWGESILLVTLKSFCPNITYLNISSIGFSSQLLELIGILQKLQFLTLGLWYLDDISEEQQVIQFAEILPLTLQYLDIRGSFLNSHINILLDNCFAPLKKLLIHRFDNEKQVKALIEFCIRKRTLHYVGVNMYFDDNFIWKVESYVTVVPYDRLVVDC
ncbi:hypothetical protein C2G38_2163773 [Gigaspora rosea]|uniref:F-box domain-containing protein n=1 Tax=Gigaspora rosea TaxID=44941 RepID=A0A397W4H7_9GLOM|nr:hypothetical protein C2G38_2163773 [Gigaspora rosea]